MAVDLSAFPKLTASNHRVTSDPSTTYNCIAWAAGRTDAWWEPLPAAGYYWPPGIPEDYSVGTLIALFCALGYTPCSSASHETGFEKVAIYAAEDEWEHATRQLDSAVWTSKLGPDDDISHDGHDLLEGPKYAAVVQVLRRATPGSAVPAWRD